MLREDEVLAALHRHRTLFNQRKRDEWLDNFVPEPYLEEPVGSGIRWGREQYARTIDALIDADIAATIHEPTLVIVNGNRAAMHFTTSVVMEGHEQLSPVIEEFEVAPEGRIAGVRAFVDPGVLATLPAEQHDA